MSVEQEIRQLFQARSVALVQKDALTLERLLADEFRYIILLNPLVKLTWLVPPPTATCKS